MRRLPALILALVLLAVPATAGAAVRQAVPTGGATSGPCDAAAPCTLDQAIGGAAANDTVRLAGGTYAFAAPLELTAGGLAVEGDPGTAPPLLQWTGSPSASALYLGADDQTLRHLRVEGSVNGAQTLVRTNPAVVGATVERVEVRNAGSGTGVAVRSSVVRDSVVVSTGDAGIAMIATGTIAGSTVVADGLGGQALYASTVYFGGSAAVTVRNTILRGAASGWDGVVEDNDGFAGTAATLDVDRSSFGAGRLDRRGTDTEVVTGLANITTVGPLLAALAGGADIHQLRGSPTIDAGAGSASAGERDIDGDPRVFGTAIDIGADEYLPPPAVAIQNVVVSDTGAAVSGLVTPRGSDTTWSLDYGPTSAYGSSASGGSVPGTAESQAVGATLSGLTPGTTYHVRLVGSSAKGTTAGPDVTFRTTTSPAGEAAAARPRITGASLAHRSLRRGRLASLRVRSAGVGTLEYRHRPAPAWAPQRRRLCRQDTPLHRSGADQGAVAQGALGRQRAVPDRHHRAAPRALPADACRRQRRRQAFEAGRARAADPLTGRERLGVRSGQPVPTTAFVPSPASPSGCRPRPRGRSSRRRCSW